MCALPLSFWVSWRRRAQQNWHIKLALTAAAVLGLVRFLGGLRGIATLDEARFPLADLFLWVQVIHGFDVPARKDLYFSLGSSLALMAVAGTLSQDLSFLPLLVVYFVFAIASLVLAHASEAAEGATAASVPREERRSWAGGWKAYVRALVFTGLAGAIVFLVLPQPQTVSALSLPFKVGSGLGLAAGEGIANPGFTSSPSERSSGASYYGFGDRLDLRVRGDLPDNLVMRVRASAPALWKGVIFDTYDGSSWSGAQGEPVSLGLEPPYPYPLQFRNLGPRVDVTQTFYVEQEQPNIIFAAGQPETVWFDGGVQVDELGALRTASSVTDGTVYSVVSSRGSASPSELRAVTGEVPPTMDRYLQLPDELPQRVGALAQRITRHSTSVYDKV
ncbi:MAG: DUF3488 domain-containing protein, partial [Gammaproteobacteria bacterium]